MGATQKSRGRSRTKPPPNPLVFKIMLVCLAVVFVVCVAVIAVLLNDVHSTSETYLDSLQMKSANGIIDSKLKFKTEWDASQILVVEEQIKAKGGSYSGTAGVVDSARGLSGIMFGEHPAELFMVCMTFESGAGLDGLINGDQGRAYGMMQLDYRYPLVPWMKWVYAKNPTLWAGLGPYITYSPGDARLVNNSSIISTFESALASDPASYVQDQTEYFYNSYFLATYTAMNEAGYNLDARHIGVSAALFSSNVNCGQQTAKYLAAMSVDMTDEEMINTVYHLRRTGVTKTNNMSGSRWAVTGENDMVLKLLSGYYTVYSDITDYNSFSPGWYWSKFPAMYGTGWYY